MSGDSDRPAAAAGGEGTDADELARFGALAADFWDETGPMAPLHRLNPARLRFIRDHAIAHFGRDPERLRALEGLRVLDVGCGGGLLAEPLARLGAQVTGIDPVAGAIETARAHAAETGVAVAYACATLDDLLNEGRVFDLVIASEVIEHVPDQPGFVARLAAAAAPGGAIVATTLNRSPRACLEAIVGAEYLLGWLPRGTHRYRQFVRPSELARWLREAGFRVTALAGARPDAALERFELVRQPDVNYFAFAADARGP